MRKVASILTVLILIIAVHTALAQNVEYVASYDTPGRALGVFISGQFAYVVDSDSGLLVLDISDPSNPMRTGSLQTQYPAIDVCVSGNYAYVAEGFCWGGTCIGGLVVVDVSNPASPDSVGGCETGMVRHVFVYESYAYVTDEGFMGSSMLYIFDVSEPDSPGLVNSLAPNCGDQVSFGDIFVSGDYLYIDCGGSELMIMNVSDPYDLIEVGNCWLPPYIEGIIVAGDYVYVADYWGGLQIVNVTEPSDPTITGSHDTPGEALDVFVSGHYAYVADGDSGLQIIDVSEPADPVLAGGYDTPDYARRIYLQDDLIYVADTSSLMILRFNPQTNIERPNTRPGQFSLDQNYPNPFNLSTVIRFSLPYVTNVEIGVYDLLGRHVETLYDGARPAGYYQLIWNAEDFSSGIYFYRLQAGNYIEMKKMLLIK